MALGAASVILIGVIAAFVVFGGNDDGQDYRCEFAKDWAQAEIYAEEIRPLLVSALDGDTLLADVGLAVVFPELTRYSYIRDFAETSALELFYIMRGRGNFSIGKFQMKPSFAVMIEQDALPVCRGRFPILFQTGRNERERRIFRVMHLRTLETQTEYFAVFLRVMEARFPTLRRDPVRMVRIFASAYNSGYRRDSSWRGLQDLEQSAKSRFFPYGVLSGRKQYSYCAISEEYYRERGIMYVLQN